MEVTRIMYIKNIVFNFHSFYSLAFLKNIYDAFVSYILVMIHFNPFQMEIFLAVIFFVSDTFGINCVPYSLSPAYPFSGRKEMVLMVYIPLKYSIF